MTNTTFTVSKEMLDYYATWHDCHSCDVSDFVKYQLMNGAIYVAHKSSSAFAEDVKLMHLTPEKIKPITEDEFKCLDRVFKEKMGIRTQLAETYKVFGDRAFIV